MRGFESSLAYGERWKWGGGGGRQANAPRSIPSPFRQSNAGRLDGKAHHTCSDAAIGFPPALRALGAFFPPLVPAGQLPRSFTFIPPPPPLAY